MTPKDLMNKMFTEKPLQMLIVYNTTRAQWIGIVKDHTALWLND